MVTLHSSTYRRRCHNGVIAMKGFGWDQSGSGDGIRLIEVESVPPRDITSFLCSRTASMLGGKHITRLAARSDRHDSRLVMLVSGVLS